MKKEVFTSRKREEMGGKKGEMIEELQVGKKSKRTTFPVMAHLLESSQIAENASRMPSPAINKKLSFIFWDWSFSK